MGSGSSRVETWWEAEAQRKVIATRNSGEVEVICSLIPVVDEIALVGSLKARPDLEMLFALYCGYQNLSGDQRVDLSALTVDSKANELWRVLRMPPGSGEAPWNWNWQPPLEGVPSEIAAEFHATVCQAIFRVPLFDFVKYALGYITKTHFLNSLLDAICDVRNHLRTEFRCRPETKGIYIEVEKALEQRYHPLAHWIVASSLDHSTNDLYDTLAPNLKPIQKIFSTRDFDLVLTRLAALDRRFAHGSQMYNWQKWSTDLDFWYCVDGALWSGKFTTPFMPLHLTSEDRDERLRFLDGFKTGAKDKAWGGWTKAVFSMKRLIARDRNFEGRESQYSVKKGLMSMGLLKDSPGISR